MKQTQITRLLKIMRRHPSGMSYMELLRTGVSVCPWKRLEEAGPHLKPGERIGRRLGRDKLVRIYIMRDLQA